MPPRENRFDLRPGIRRFFRLPLRTTQSIHADADEELESLIAARIDEFQALGMSPDAARAEALRRLGVSLDAARRQVHHSADLRERRMRIRDYIDDLLQDLRYAARGLAQRPLFSALVIVTLAIGIGATTAIFSAVNVLLLRPLPFSHPDELMKISLVSPPVADRKGNDQMVWSYPKYTAFRDAQTSFANMALYESKQFTLKSDGVDLVLGETVGATYLRTLGIHTVLGHDFDSAIDAHGGAPPQVLLSYAFWQTRYGGDPSIIGKTIALDDRYLDVPFTVIGVVEPGFAGLSGRANIFEPVTDRPAGGLTEPQGHEFSLVGRRKPSVTAAQANAATVVLGARIDALYPHDVPKKSWSANARSLDDLRTAPLVRESLLILFGAVTFVLLIACVNIANLLLGRATGRRREIAVRLAIGAGRGRLVRLLLAESVLLSLVGGVASLAIAWLGAHALSKVNPATTFRGRGAGGLGAVSFTSVDLDWRALGFALALSLIVGLVFGLVPALSATRASLAETLKGAAPRGDRGARITVRRTLVVAEVALAMVLLAGSGLMIRSLANLLSTDFGFDGRNVLTLTVIAIPSGPQQNSPANFPGFYENLTARLAAIPGVTHVGLGDCPPLNGGCSETIATIKDGVAVDPSDTPLVGIHLANDEWFAALGIPLKRGRLFATSDIAKGPKVLLLNEAAARAYFPGVNPIGHTLGVGQSGMEDGAEVIGVVGGVRQSADSAPGPEVYASITQAPRQRLTVFLRTQNDPSTIVPDVRRAIREVAPASPFDQFLTMSSRTDTATAQPRFAALLLGLFAATALSLAIVGIYGVMSFAVTARTREIGIRMALGAEQARVQRLVIGEGVALVSVGALIGLAGALASTRVLRNFLFDMKPSDPATYVAILLILGAAAIAASWLPARRAARVDPVNALRAD
ncbi:MAG TPA: ABC transporter permease [Gemmatimonadaceae bacterium]|jgi:predicted permease